MDGEVLHYYNRGGVLVSNEWGLKGASIVNKLQYQCYMSLTKYFFLKCAYKIPIKSSFVRSNNYNFSVLRRKGVFQNDFI